MKAIFITIYLILIFSNVSYAKPYYEFTKKELKNKKIGIFGSFKCYESHMLPAIEFFEKNKSQNVSFPIKSKIVDHQEDFIKFIKDAHIKEKIDIKCKNLRAEAYQRCAESFEKELQQAVFDKTRNNIDMVYVMNPKTCNIGFGTASEIGYVLGVNDTRNDFVNFFKNHNLDYLSKEQKQKLIEDLNSQTFFQKQIQIHSSDEPATSHIRFYCKY